MDILAMSIVTIVAVGLGIECWILSHARRQQRQIDARLDTFAIKLVNPPKAAVVEVIYESEMEASRPTVAPAFILDVLGGGRVSLGDLLTPSRPLVLLFTHPKCGPCYELLPDIGGWQRDYGDRLTIALISSGEARTNRAMSAEYGVQDLLLQRESEVFDAYGLEQLPVGVLINADGRIAAEPSYGVPTIRRLVADTLGVAMPVAPSVDRQPALQRGAAVPALRRPALDGSVIDFAALAGAPTLMLFWSPGCSHCQDVLAEIKAFEQAMNRTRLLIVSRGPIGLNQEVGFNSTVILDDDHSISRLFGSSGTPAAILIDSRGSVATPLARGTNGVRAALRASVFSADVAMSSSQRSPSSANMLG